VKALVVGATGRNAGLVVPELTQRDVTVRALVRDQCRVETARRRGAVETVIGDLGDEPSLRAAAKGVDAVFHINPAFDPREAEMGVAMVKAATAAGVSKFVFSSVYHPSISKMVNHASKQPVEEALFESGMDFTILQPSMFMQNLEGAWNSALETGRLTMPYSMHAKVCYVDYRDVAEAAALAITGDTLSYGTFELSAPGMVDRFKLAAIASSVAGRALEAAEISPAEWANSAPTPDGPFRQGLARMNAHYDEHGFPGGNALVLRAILGRAPRTLEQYFRELGEGVR